MLASNYRFGRREVDLIASRGGVIAFVEVKTRAGPGFGRPEESISARKRREIELVAREFTVRRGLVGRPVRFDVIAVELERGGLRCEHIEDAWRPGWC